MNWQRALAFGAAGGMLAAWAAGAAMTSPRPALDVPVSRPTAADVQGHALDAEILRLRERLRPTELPQQPGRNLFSFAASPRAAARSSHVIAPEPPAAPIAAPAAPSPPLSLIGLAEDHTADGVVRTAIVSGFGEVFLAKEGDPIAGRYRIIRIGAEGVVVTDLVDSTSTTLHLK